MREVPPAIRILVAEHDLCRHFLQATASALAQTTSNQMRATETALGQVWSLLEFLEGGLEVHIAKEEGPLFPRLKAALPADDRLVDEMVAEHDLVRIKRGDLRGVLDGLSSDHGHVRGSRNSLRSVLAGDASVSALKEATMTVAAKLGVHFDNEEDLVFPLVADLLTADEQAQVLLEMAAIESQG